MPSAQLDPSHLPNVDTERSRVAQELMAEAQQCRARGELISAMLAASDALMLFPAERECLDLVDAIAQSTNDPLSLVPVESGAVHVATAAVRARILLMQQKWGDAISLLTRVVEVSPRLGYLDWLTRWLQPQVIEALGWDELAPTVVTIPIKIAIGCPPHPEPSDRRLANLRAAAQYFPALRNRYPEQAVLWFGEAMIRRRLGDTEATVRIATEAAARFPSDWRVVTCFANALGDAKRCDEALTQARRAIELDPEDFSPLHDVAWAYLDAGRAGEAMNLFNELLQRDPKYPAQAAMHYARVLATNSPADRQALLEMRDSDWDDGEGLRLANRLDPPDPFYNLLPETGEATVAGARGTLRGLAEVLRCCGAGGTLNGELISRYAESPSVNLAFNLAVRAAGGSGGNLQITVEKYQTPDPRLDKSQVAHRVWTYEGQNPRPAYGPANPNAQQAVGQLASLVYRMDIWSSFAQQVGSQFGPDWVHGFLNVMTDPPLPPQGGRFDAITWTYRCQIAAAVILSYLGPWETSPGRHALYSLIYGPTDWTTVAGLIALGWRARLDPRLRPEAEQVFGWMRAQLPKEGFTVWEAPLAKLWFGLGNHPPALEQDLKSWIDEYEATCDDKNVARHPGRKYGGLDIKAYAEFCYERDRIMSAHFPPGTPTAALAQRPIPELSALCERFGVPVFNQSNGTYYPYIEEWQRALNEDSELQQMFTEITQRLQLAKQGVSGSEVAALNEIRAGEMDMHLRMAQAQQAQRQVAEGNAGDPDPVVFPGQPVARLSDYVGIMKGMQAGDMMGALARYGLDMMSYGAVATAWGAKMAADPVLTEKFTRMMAS